MSARDALRKYVNLLADWWTPPSVTEERVERLYGQVRAEVLRNTAREARRLAGHGYSVEEVARHLDLMATAAHPDTPGGAR